MTARRRRLPGDEFVPEDLPGLLGVPLSEEQLVAATAPMGPQLIVAGAGTGKTTVMAARVAWLVATGQVSPEGVLGLTFTNKAAGELRSRIRRVLFRIAAGQAGGRDRASAAVRDTAEPTVMTYHSFAGRLVSEYGLLIGIEPVAATLTDALRAGLAFRVACEPKLSLDGNSLLARGTPTSLAERILLLDDALADLDVETADLRSFDYDLKAMVAAEPAPAALLDRVAGTASDRADLSLLVDQFRSLKSQESRHDFADQVRHSCALARRVPAVPDAIQGQYPIVLLDEYQDTSRSQRRMIQSLCGSGHAVTAVGDPCQAIYGWRGASVTNIDRFPSHFSGQDGAPAEVYSLTVNRRSTREVIAVANRVSTDLRGVHAHMRALRSGSEAEAGEVSCALLETQDDEVEWMVDRVDEVCQRRAPRDVAVLCRTNGQIAIAAGALVERGIPVHVAAKQALLLMPQVQDVIALLRLMIDPYANPSLMAYLTGPRIRIGPRDLSLLGQRAKFLANDGSDEESTESRDLSLLDAVMSPGSAAYSPEARERFEEVTHLVRELRWLRGRPVVEIAETILAKLGIPCQWISGPGSDADAAVMGEFLNLAQEFEGLDGSRSLASFLSYVDDCERFGTQPSVEHASGDNRVTLMTVHGAKGLEFPVVVLPFVSQGVFPGNRGRSRWPTSSTSVPQPLSRESDASGDPDFPEAGLSTKSHREFVDRARASEMLDEDRLAYVAVTRAEQELIMSGHWWGPTQTRPRGPSIYLEAAKRICEELGTGAQRWEPAPDDGATSPCLTSPAEAIMWPVSSVSAEARRVCEVVNEARERCAESPTGEILNVDPICSDVLHQSEIADENLDAPQPELEPEPDLALSPETWRSRVGRVLKHLDGKPVAIIPPAVLSASSVIARRQDPVAFAERLARPMPRPVSSAAVAGTAFHEWIEQQLGQQSLFEFDETGGLLDAEPGVDEQHLRDMFQRTSFAGRTPVAVEQPFTVQIGGLVVTGQIDAVFENDSGFEVIDWKTGSQALCDPYQLALYRHAWCAIADVPTSCVSAAFVFLSTGEVVWHDDLPDVVGLA